MTNLFFLIWPMFVGAWFAAFLFRVRPKHEQLEDRIRAIEDALVAKKILTPFI